MSVAAASLEVKVEPDLAAAVALAMSVVAIDLWALQSRRSTVSRWVRHQLRHRPAVTLTAALILGLHLAHEWPADPAGWVARRLDRSRR